MAKKRKSRKKKSPSLSVRKNGKSRLQELRELYHSKDFAQLDRQLADVDLSMEKGEYATIQVLCSLAMGDYDKALDAAALAVTLQPDKFEYLFNLAVCLANKGNNALALKVYQEITEKFPEDDRPYRNMSEIFERRGQYELALTCVKKMLQLGGDKGIGFKAMANYSLEMGNLAKAAEYYEKALAYCENTAPVWVGIAMVFASKGDKEGAPAGLPPSVCRGPGSLLVL